MNVVMVHPQHGAKIAINEIEIEQDEKAGWTRYNADTPAESVAAPVRRGRPRRVTESIEQPNSATLASDESEGV